MKTNLQIKAALFVSLVFLNLTPLFSQEKTEESDYFFKDTLLVFNGLKIEFIKCSATAKKLKVVLNVTNQDKNYYILDPVEVAVNIPGNDIKIRDTKHEKVILPPLASKKIKLEFEGLNYRVPSVNINFTKFKISDAAVTTYTFEDMSVTKENFCKSGPVIWFLEKKDFDIHKGIRLSGKLKYNGDKLLVIHLENAVFKTSDGGSFNNIGEPGWLYPYNSSYFDFKHNFEKEILFFPAKRINLRDSKKAVLNLTNVFSEYSLAAIAGFNIQLYKGNTGNQ